MSKGLGSLTVTAIAEKTATPCIFFELELDASTERFHTHLGLIQWGANNWLGMGEFAAVDEIGEGDGLDPEPLRVGLNLATAAILDIVDNHADEVYNRPAKAFLGALDDAFQLLEDPGVLWSGFAQQIAYTMGADEDAVSLTAESETAFFNLPSRLAYSDAQLQSEYAGDLFLQYQSQIADFRTVWRGRSSARIAPGNPTIYPGVIPGQPSTYPQINY